MYNNYGPGALLENDTRLYDLKADPGQAKPVQNSEHELRLQALMARLMQANEVEEAERLFVLGFDPSGDVFVLTHVVFEPAIGISNFGPVIVVGVLDDFGRRVS